MNLPSNQAIDNCVIGYARKTHVPDLCHEQQLDIVGLYYPYWGTVIQLIRLHIKYCDEYHSCGMTIAHISCFHHGASDYVTMPEECQQMAAEFIP